MYHQEKKVHKHGSGSGNGNISSEEFNTLKEAIVAQNELISAQNETIASLREDLTEASTQLRNSIKYTKYFNTTTNT